MKKEKNPMRLQATGPVSSLVLFSMEPTMPPSAKFIPITRDPHFSHLQIAYTFKDPSLTKDGKRKR